jgi:hypothetical protein
MEQRGNLLTIAGTDSALLHLQRDGSFVLAGTFGENGTVRRTEFDADGSLSVLVVQGKNWVETTLDVDAAYRRDGVLSLRSARSAADGGIEARSMVLWSNGGRRDRELYTDTDQNRRWTVSERLPDGSRLEGEGTFADGVAALTRRRSGRYGERLWVEERKTTVERRDGGPADSASAVAETTSTTTFEHGGSRESRWIAFPSDVGVQLRATSNVIGLVSDESSESVETILNPDGSLTTITVRTFPDGSETTTTVTERHSDPLSPVVTDTTETTIVAQSSDGSSGVHYHETNVITTDTSSGTTSGSWEKTYVDDSGQTVSESKGWATDAAGNTSETTSVQSADGTVTITTTTTDSSGVGTTTTTTTAPDGRTSTTTAPEGGPATDGSGPSGGDGPGGDGPGGDGPGGDGPDLTDLTGLGNFCMDVGSLVVCTDKKLAPEYPAEQTLPRQTARTMNAINDPRSLAGADLAVPLADRVAAGVRQAAFLPASRSARTAGEEEPATVSLDEHAVRTIGRVHASTEWSVQHDPAAQVAYATALVSALAQTTGNAEKVNRALLACGRLAREVERRLARCQP